MRQLLIICIIALLFSCEEQRYFAESDETKTLEAGIEAYENGDWDKWRSHFADTAKIFVNSTEGISLDERLEGLKGLTGEFSSYGFDKTDS